MFLYLRRLISHIVDGTTQKLKEFRFVPSANTQAALDGVLLLVKRPHLIKTRGFMFFEASVEKRATKALFRSYPRPLLSLSLSLNLVARRFPVLKYATRNWQLVRAQANKQYYTWENACVRVETFQRERGKKLIERFFHVFQCFATRNEVWDSTDT